MRLIRIAAVATLAVATLAVGLAGPARAEDPAPTPTAPTAEPTPPVVPPPITPPVEPPPLEPPAPPARDRLPLRKGDAGPMVATAQERLEWLGYRLGTSNTSADLFGESTRTIVKRFQVKYFLKPTGVIDKRTWSVLKEMAEPVGRLPKACTDVGMALCLDKTAKTLRWVDDGKIRLTIDVRFGLAGMDTREGTFRVYWKSRDHTSSLYDSWMPYALFFSGGQAVHYSPYFARDGYNGGSHGCVGIRDIKTAAWLFDRIPTGTRVYVYRS
jgi:hypothetical protein